MKPTQKQQQFEWQFEIDIYLIFTYSDGKQTKSKIIRMCNFSSEGRKSLTEPDFLWVLWFHVSQPLWRPPSPPVLLPIELSGTGDEVGRLLSQPTLGSMLRSSSSSCPTANKVTWCKWKTKHEEHGGNGHTSHFIRQRLLFEFRDGFFYEILIFKM